MADEEPKDPKTEEQTVEPAAETVPVAGAGEAEAAPSGVATEAVAEAGAEAEPEAAVAASEPVDEAALGDELTPEELEEARANEVAFSWEASEFVHHHKGPMWYMVLFGVLAVFIAASAWLQLWLEIGLFVAMGGAIIVYARKPPRTLLYELTPKGITIDGKAVPFSELRSFGVLKETEWHTIDLEPTKRFSPRLAILFDSDDFDSVVGHLELHLPRADRDPDLIERVTRYLRF